ncbi:MAG: DUF4340 domain-containing protein [Verrucomicrobiota bacterium]|nr:DUF4340 domain-containing protein [Limisphaera sp.]MDW8383087.1 DUF4340 domain-containing protein [Verrucomicrobiota bacterium]
MNRKQFALLLGLVVVLGGAGYWLYRQEIRTWRQGHSAEEAKLLPGLPINDIAHVRILQGTQELNLVKKEGLWRVRERADYPANFQQIGDWILKASELKAVQVEEVGPSQLGRLSLLPPNEGTNAAVLVEFMDAQGKRVGGLLLGKTQSRASAAGFGNAGEDSFPAGRWVMSLAATNRAVMISEALSHIEARPELWISKDFFKIERPRLIRVEFPDATNSWSIRREKETDTWQLVDAEPGQALDVSKATSATSGLSWPSFMDVLAPDTSPASVGLDRPFRVYVETFDHFTYEMTISPQTNQNYYLRVAVKADLPQERTPGADEKPEDKERLDREFKEKREKLVEKLAQERKLEGWIYQVSSWTFDSLLKPRHEMLTSSSKPAGADDQASRVESENQNGEQEGEPNENVWTQVPGLE